MSNRRHVAVWLAALALLLGPAPSPRAQDADPPLAGGWEGTIRAAGTTLGVRVVFAGSGDGLQAGIDIPQQGAAGQPLTAMKRDGATVHFELPTRGARAIFDGRIDGDTIAGTFTQGSTTGTFRLTRAAAPARSTAPPPYAEHEFTVSNGEIRLAGTLSVPAAAGPFPLVVMITGSGAQSRDEDISGFKVFQVMADALTRQGVAVYRHDDRGVGGSTGSLAASTTADFASDALAAVSALRSRADVDPRRVGLIGHSEGATAAAIAASRSADVAFAILLAPPGMRGAEVLRQQAANQALALGAGRDDVARVVAAHRGATEAVLTGASTDEVAAAVRELIRAQYDSMPNAQKAALGDREAFADRAHRPAAAQLTSPWMKFMLGFDPAGPLRALRSPVLALFGGLDTQVPPSANEAPVRAALADNARATIRVYEDANHLFQRARTGLVTEYAGLEKAFVPGLLDDVAAWIGQVTGR